MPVHLGERELLAQFVAVVIEPPDVNYPWLKAGRIKIDAGEG